MKKILSALMCVIMLFAATSCSGTQNTASEGGQSSSTSDTASQNESTKEPAGFTVSGTKLLDGYGNEFVMRGVNHAHTWFKDQLDTAIAGIATTGANTVRIILSDGDQWDKDSRNTIEKIIKRCKQNKLIMVMEVHDSTGMDDISYLNNAVDYWIEMKDALIGNEAYVILNIANEWYGSYNNLEKWRDAYLEAIPKLREAGIKNTLLVDSAGWGQCYDSTLSYANEIFDSDPDKNTMFAVHMYGTAGKNAAIIKKIIDTAVEKNICLTIGEFGYNHTDGDVDEETIMSYCTEKNIGYLAWSWKGNGSGVEYLNVAQDWGGTMLSPEWGEPLVNGPNGIKATSKICSVYATSESEETSSADAA